MGANPVWGGVKEAAGVVVAVVVVVVVAAAGKFMGAKLRLKTKLEKLAFDKNTNIASKCAMDFMLFLDTCFPNLLMIFSDFPVIFDVFFNKPCWRKRKPLLKTKTISGDDYLTLSLLISECFSIFVFYLTFNWKVKLWNEVLLKVSDIFIRAAIMRKLNKKIRF